MTIQTTVSNNMASAREGMVKTSRHNVSRVADTDMPAGRVVSIGAAYPGCKLPASAGDLTGFKALGVTRWDPAKEPNDATNEYAHEDTVSVVQVGEVWLIAEDAMAEGAAVYVRHTATGGEELGRIRSDADTADAVAVAGMRTITSTSGADELILVAINLPVA